MSSLGNKEVMSKNLKYYIEKSGKDRRTLAEIWGFPYSTVTEWINGNKYPRIDRIEIMADYFGIKKSDLIEDKTEEQRRMEKNNDAIADIVVRLMTDEKCLQATRAICSLDEEQLDVVNQMLSALLK